MYKKCDFLLWKSLFFGLIDEKIASKLLTLTESVV